MLKREHILLNKIIQWVILPIFLFTAWLFLTATFLLNFILETDYSFSILSKNYSVSSAVKEHENSRLITGKLMPTENHLGIVVIPFDVKNTTPNTAVAFRIKESGAEKWQHTVEANSIHFRFKPLYPFGFPIYDHSKGKSYIFEVISMSKDPNATIKLDEKYPIVTKHQYPKDLLFNDNELLLSFLQKKIIYIGQNSYLIIATFAYAFPLLFYIFFFLLSPKKYVPKQFRSFLRKNFLRYIKTNEIPTFYIVILLILSDILFLPFRNDYIIFFLVCLWLFITYKNTNKSILTFVLSFFLVLIAFLLTLFQLPSIAEKAAIWSIILLITGTIYSMVDIYRHRISI